MAVVEAVGDAAALPDAEALAPAGVPLGVADAAVEVVALAVAVIAPELVCVAAALPPVDGLSLALAAPVGASDGEAAGAGVAAAIVTVKLADTVTLGALALAGVDAMVYTMHGEVALAPDAAQAAARTPDVELSVTFAAVVAGGSVLKFTAESTGTTRLVGATHVSSRCGAWARRRRTSERADAPVTEGAREVPKKAGRRRRRLYSVGRSLVKTKTGRASAGVATAGADSAIMVSHATPPPQPSTANPKMTGIEPEMVAEMVDAAPDDAVAVAVAT